MLDLEFTSEQEMLRDAVRGLLADHCSTRVVREMEDDPVGYPAELWARLGALDLIGLLLPERYGGSGMTLLEGAVLYEELGRALAPVPHFVSAVLVGGVLARAAAEPVQAAWLPRIASGEAIVTPAWLEPESGFGPRGVQLQAVRKGGDWRLDGVKQHVAFAQAADALLVLARTGPDPEDVGLFLVDREAAGVALRQQHTIASDTQYRVELHDVVVGEDRVVGQAGDGWAVWDAVMRDGIVLLAAQAVGGARAALDLTVQYAKDRHQFGKPLGAFQAIAHYLADAVTAVDGAEQLVHEAAWAGATGSAADGSAADGSAADGTADPRLAPMTKLFATRTFRDVTAMAQQVFGGVGFTLEFDIQLYFRRAKALQISWWDTRYLENLVAAAILD